ncbi:hypothetical protein PUN28_013070 [Cardiocondyla obscurior]|uniref:Uncharacterized protein n=1 Tax=Cardiocondyla obscurior TaxID=286306 RepID=A0AAW2FCF1_9HYME
MIKLFLVTLLCVAVLADPPNPVDGFNQMMQKAREMAEQGANMMTSMSGGSPLVRRAASSSMLAQNQMGPPQGPPPRPPNGQQSEQNNQE